MTLDGDGDCHCNAIRGTMYLRIVGKIQSVSPIGFPEFVFEFSLTENFSSSALNIMLKTPVNLNQERNEPYLAQAI